MRIFNILNMCFLVTFPSYAFTRIFFAHFRRVEKNRWTDENEGRLEKKEETETNEICFESRRKESDGDGKLRRMAA